MKNALILLLFFSYSFVAHSQNGDDGPVIFRKQLTEINNPEKQPWPLPKDLRMPPTALSAPLDTKYNWLLLHYQKCGWKQITGRNRSDYEKTYINTKPEMRFSSALLEKTFGLSEPGSNWKIRQQPSASGDIYLVISSYRGNPAANITSWEEEEFYVFTQYGLYENTHFKLDHLLEESADPTSFQGERSVTGEIAALMPYAVADTGKWQLLGYEEWSWLDMLGNNVRATDYRKHTAIGMPVFSGKELKKEFNPADSGNPPILQTSATGWRSYRMADGTLVIQMNTYQVGDMTDWGYTASYYFLNIK